MDSVPTARKESKRRKSFAVYALSFIFVFAFAFLSNALLLRT